MGKANYQRIKSALNVTPVEEGVLPSHIAKNELYVADNGSDIQIYDPSKQRFKHVAGKNVELKARNDILRHLKAYYSLNSDVQEGTSIQDDVHSFNGTRKNKANVFVLDVAKLGAHSLAFKATGYIDIGDITHVGTTPFTISMWIKGANHTLARSAPTTVDDNSQYWHLSLEPNDNDPNVGPVVRFTTHDGTTESNVHTSISSSLWPSEWIFIAATRNGNTLKLYVNDDDPIISKTAGTGTIHYDNANGTLSDPVEGITGQGQLDEIGLWHRELSTDEVWFLYNRGDGRNDFLNNKWYEFAAQEDVNVKNHHITHLKRPTKDHHAATKAYTDERSTRISMSVAAFNAPTYVRSNANYVCDGTNDHIQIQNALDDANSTEGTQDVVLSGGLFIVSTTIILHQGQMLRGRQTEIRLADTAGDRVPVINANSNNITIEHITINGHKSRSGSSLAYHDDDDGIRFNSNNGVLRDVTVKQCQGEGIEIRNGGGISDVRIESCCVHDCAGSGIRIDDGESKAMITNCLTAQNGHDHAADDAAGLRLHADTLQLSNTKDTGSYVCYVVEPSQSDSHVSLTQCMGEQTHNTRPAITAGINNLWKGWVSVTSCAFYQSSTDGGPIAQWDTIGPGGKLIAGDCTFHMSSSGSTSFNGTALSLGGSFQEVSIHNCHFKNRDPNNGNDCVLVQSGQKGAQCILSGIRVHDGYFHNTLSTTTGNDEIVLLTGSILWNVRDDTGTLVTGTSHNREKTV
jgi:hypothetical protein